MTPLQNSLAAIDAKFAVKYVVVHDECAVFTGWRREAVKPGLYIIGDKMDGITLTPLMESGEVQTARKL